MRTSAHVVAPALLAATLAAGGCTTGPAELSGDPRPTFETIEASLAVGCGGDACHVRTPGAGPAAARLDLTPGMSFRQLLGPDCRGQASGQDFAGAESPLLVVRGDPAHSYLVCKLDPECMRIAPGTTHMPPLGGVRDPVLLARVRAWIADGALGPPDPEGDGCEGPPRFGGATSASQVADGVALTWEPAADPAGAAVIGYRVYVGTAAGRVDYLRPRLDLPPPGEGAEPVTGATVTGLPAGWSYVLVARAYTLAGGEDGNRVEVGAELRDTTPPEFAGLSSATSLPDGRVHLTWSAGSDDADPPSRLRYLVLFSAVPGAYDTTAPAVVTEPGVLEADVAPLAGLPSQFVTVRARDTSGNVSAPTVESALAGGDRTPPVFGGATSATASPGAVTVRWDPAADDVTPASELVYLVYSGTGPGSALLSEPAVSPPGATSLSVGRLAVSTTYYFVVRARDAAGNVDANEVEVSATTPATADTTPPTFAGASGAEGISSGVRLRWAAASDDTAAAADLQYLVWSSAVAGGEALGGAPQLETAPGATSLDVLGLAPGTPTFFVVRARDPAGNVDANTVEVSAAPIADTTPPTFAGLATATAVSPTAVSLGWAAASDDATAASAITYLVFVGDGPGPVSTATPAATTPAGATSFVVTGLTTGVEHSFLVRARDAAGNVDGNTAQQTVSLADSAPPTFGGATSARAVGSTSIELAWSPASDDATATSGIVYLVHVAMAAGGETFATPSMTTPAGATGTVVTGLSPDTSYFFVVRARDAAGNVDTNSREVSARTSAPMTVSYSRDVQPIWTAECATAGCHAGARPASSLLLASGSSYAALVGVVSSSCAPRVRVVAGDSASSYLWAKLTGVGICSGTQMPKSGATLTAGQLDLVRAWIDGGARND